MCHINTFCLISNKQIQKFSKINYDLNIYDQKNIKLFFINFLELLFPFLIKDFFI